LRRRSPDLDLANQLKSPQSVIRESEPDCRPDARAWQRWLR
jgi:hypothetical protein